MCSGEMMKQDARKLDHKSQETMRILVVKKIQCGQSPETVIRTLAFFDPV